MPPSAHSYSPAFAAAAAADARVISTIKFLMSPLRSAGLQHNIF